MIKHTFAAGLFALVALPAMANPHASAMRDYLHSTVATWANDPVLVQAIKSQNEKTAPYAQADIDAMEFKWRAELYNPTSDLISAVLSGPAAEFLRAQVEASGGTITEAFVMDAKGLNVAVSQLTSDYWQGDEDKFRKTYLVGAEASFVDDVEYDQSTGAVQGQISVTITDPDTGIPIGALTVGVDLSALS